MTADEARLTAAYDTCLRIARGHYENFPVASWLVPAGLRRHVAAVYAFARTADDFADEGGYTQRERLRLLDEWLDHLHRALGAGEPIDDGRGAGAGGDLRGARRHHCAGSICRWPSSRRCCRRSART